MRNETWARATFSPGGLYLAGVASESQLELWNLKNGSLQELSIPETSDPVKVIFARDDSLLGLVHKSQVLVWTLPYETDEQPRVFDTQSQVALKVALFGEELNQLIASDNNGIFVWPLEGNSGTEANPPIIIDGDRLTGRFDQRSLVLAQNGRDVVSGGWHNTIVQVELSAPCLQRLSQSFADRHNCSSAIGPRWSWDRWSENVQRGDHVSALDYHPAGTHLAAASANRLLVGEINGEQINFQRDNHLYETRRRITALAFSNSGDAIALASADGVVLLSFPEREVIATFAPADPLSEVDTLSFSADGSVLAYGDGSHTEFREVDLLRNSAFVVSEEQYNQNENTYQSTARLNELLQGQEDRFLRAIQAVVGESAEPGSLTIEQLDHEARLHIGEDLSLRITAQAPPGNLIALALDRFTFRGGIGQVLVYDAQLERLIMHMTLPEDHWGIDGLFFGSDQKNLWLKTSNFDGFFFGAYRWPMDRPDLTRYQTLPRCIAPQSQLAGGHPFAINHLLTCQ